MKKLFYFGSIIFLLTLSTTHVVFAQAHSGGTDVFSGQQVYRIIEGGCRGGAQPIIPTPCSQGTLRAYPSAEVFLSWPKKYWSNLVLANSGDLALPKGSFMPFAPGTLVNDNGTIYAIGDGGDFGLNDNLNNIKHGIPDAPTFLSLGYKWSNVITANTSYIPSTTLLSASNAHIPGTLISDDRTIYYITTYGKIGIASMNEFVTKGFNLKNVVPANSQDLLLQTDPYGWTGHLEQ